MSKPSRWSALWFGLVLAAGPAFAQTSAPATPSVPAPPSAGATAPAPAATPGQIAAAKDLIDVTGGLQTVQDLIPAYLEQIKRQNVTRPDLAKDLDEVTKGLQPELEMQAQQIKDEVAAIYAKYFTEAEMREVVAFFRSPTGSKYIRAQPPLIDEVVAQADAWSEKTSEYVLTRVRAEMAKRGKQLP